MGWSRCFWLVRRIPGRLYTADDDWLHQCPARTDGSAALVSGGGRDEEPAALHRQDRAELLQFLSPVAVDAIIRDGSEKDISSNTEFNFKLGARPLHVVQMLESLVRSAVKTGALTTTRQIQSIRRWFDP